MIANSLTRKSQIVDNLYYKYMNEHYSYNSKGYSRYIHGTLVAGYGILSFILIAYFRSNPF